MATRTWVGGGNNKADNPKDWSPNGAPQPDENLLMTQGTMNIRSFDLPHAMVTQGNVTINLSDNSAAGLAVFSGHADINVKGDNNLGISVFTGSATVDLAVNTHWIGGFSVFAGNSLVVNGGNHATFTNSAALDSSSAAGGVGAGIILDVDIIGNSVLAAVVGASLEVGRSVESGQTILLNRGFLLASPVTLKIDQPSQFHGLVELTNGEIDLKGLANADSYTYQNDLLSIFSGKSVIDTLRLSDPNPNSSGFVVEQKSGSVNIVSIDPTNPQVGLPLHV